MDTVGLVGERLPADPRRPAAANDDGVGGMHMYMPWWLYQQQKAGKMPFSRGYHIELGGGRGMPGAGILGGSHTHSGRRLRQEAEARPAQDLRRQCAFRGPRRDDPQREELLRDRPRIAVDQWGIPVLRFHFKWSDDEILQAKHMQDTFQEIIVAAGGKVTSMIGRPRGGRHLARR